ncbi:MULTISPECIES: gamma-glutamyltransferase [unclassified Solwaraspora]|uniref:gamma-glutamyltransferase n=1 Tax=unclassified Solwaraspora TaxID=2627926 RepID=UPI00259B210B|nr:gamma-glutamyltransferase [Solwaraspora sp. WMMA2056]WJK43196.1 gamma-glutamyltransferase [Solwaraspora sp. WMMA2056]
MPTEIAIAAPHPSALDAAADVVAAGGGVVDAALAAAAALTVAYPHQCSAGGDLIALVRTPDDQVRAVLSVGAAAVGIDVAALRATADRMPPGGPLTVTVPGVVAGWAALADLGGQLPLARVLAPAVELAAGGVPVSPGLAAAILRRLDVVRADPGLAALLLDGDGTPLPTGSVLRQPALARTLGTVGADWRDYYQGELAEALAAGLAALGSPLTAADLAGHAAEITDPLRYAAAGSEVTWSVAPPPSQGATLLAMLSGATADTATATAATTTAPANHLSAALTTARTAEQRRDALLGDPRTGPIDLDGLLLRTGTPTGPTPPTGPKPAGDTVAVTAVGSDGTAVTLIQSVFQTFGAGICEPGTGLVLHNRGSVFSLDPAHPGRLRPGARPPHTLCPAIATGPDRVLALGCQGGRAQPWILAQVAADALTTTDPAGLLARPRWVIGARDVGQDRPSLLLEPDTPDTDALRATAADLDLQVVQLPQRHDDAGHVQLARLTPAGLDAASDPRADGAARVLRGG